MESKAEGSINLCKIFIEARHEKNIDLEENFSKLNTFAKLHKKEFLQHNMDLSNNLFILLNPVKKYNCTIDPNRIIVDYDDPNKIDNFRVLASSLFKEIIKTLEIGTFQRIGLRSLWGISFENIEKINNTMRNKFLKITDEQLMLFGDLADGFHWGFNAQSGSYKVNYNFAPASFQNINIQNNIVKQNNISNYALLDIDFYSDQEIAIDGFSKFLKDALTESEKLALIFKQIIG